MALSEVFSRVVNMSLTAGAVILVVLLARLILRRAPKVFSYALWAAVLFRLLCPVSIPSPVSLLKLVDPPVSQTSPVVNRVEYIAPERVETPVLPEMDVESVHREPSVSPAPIKKTVTFRNVLPYLWLTGAAGMLLYGLVSFLRFRKHLTGALPVGGNLYLVDHLDSAFVTGLVFPKIYLPSDLPADRMEYIVAHERHHIRRLDYIAKHLSFLALCVHWFNPLVWVAFLLSGRDMEMSCDEAVIRKLGTDIRADYSESLIDLATRRVIVAGSPLAFGEGDTKRRIINLLHWKEPRKTVTLLCTAAAVLILAACAANPEKPVVISKGDGSFDKNTAVPASETHAPEATQAAKYTDTFTSTDGSIEYVIDINETVTGADMPVVEAAPYFLTEEDAKRTAEALFGRDAVFYEAEPDRLENYSKSEIQEKLNRWTQYTSDDAIRKLYGPEFNESKKEIVKRFVEKYTKKYETAPEDPPHTPCQWTYRKSMEYYMLSDELSGIDLSTDNDEISTQVKINGIPYHCSISRRDMRDYKISMVTLCITDGMGPDNLDERHFYAKLCRTPAPTESQLEDAKRKAAKILADMALGQWEIDRCYIETRDFAGDVPEYVIHVDAVPVLNGIPAIRQPQLGTLKSDKAYASNYYITDANFRFSPNGDLIFLMLYSPLEIVDTVNDNVAVKSFDELMALAKNNLQLRDNHSFFFGYFVDGIEENVGCTVTVSELSYNLARVKAPGTDQRYYYVPSVSLCGTVEYYGKDSGKIYYTSDAPETLVILNAVDGTVISQTNE